MKRKVGRIGIILVGLKVVMPTMLLLGVFIDRLRGVQDFVLPLAFGFVGAVMGLLLGVWMVRRLEAAGHRFPKVVEDGVPWTHDAPPRT